MYFGMENTNTLFLDSISENQSNGLTLYITSSQSKMMGEDELESETNPALRKMLSSCTQIIPDYSCLYKILFENYIMYQVRNESYCSFDPDEQRIGKGLIKLEKSKLLEYLGKATDVFDDGTYAYPAKYKHYGVYTANHVIDIISHCEPRIEIITLR